MIERDDGELVQERLELSLETTGHPVTRKKEGGLDQHKVFSFNELGVHSYVRQRTQQHLHGTETRNERHA